MSDESDDKTEAPTPHRLEKAREEGQIPRSRELTSLLILLVGVSVIWFGGVSLARRLSGMLSAGLHFDHSIINDPNLILGQIILLIREAMLALLPLISGVVLVAIISPVMLGGLVFSGKSLQPKFSKLNPLPGIKRTFSAQTGAELLKAILKTILVGSVTGFFLWYHWPQMMRLMAESPITAMGNAMDLVGLCALLVVLGVIPMVGFDVFFQIFSHLKKLRMSRQDIRDEFKQSEGDPHVKGRIRQMQRAAARRRMMADVPKADVIVNNPTHYSVALQYDENKMSAPKVVAKGAGLVALRIREIGAENNVPTLEAPPLARALYRHAEIGQQIPGQLYAAVAEVLAWVWQLPLPAFILDLLFTFNIALSIMVLLVAMFTQRTLEFAAFPTILLFTTLLRLALNVASTRIILMEGHTGAAAAGKVVEAFGHFLVGGNFAIGIVVFVILVIINFMVITKGAGRIAEVGARFVLDGMPGKQMAIDADLNAGLIGEDEAKKRRSEVTQEADFYGSMDGASKFVRGDAIAGILIMVINVVGGLLVGVLQHGMSMGHAAESYTLLTIGDGLVAQIPALVISTAAGVIVTRVSTDQDVGEQMVNQLFSNPSVMLLSAAVLGLLGLVPGMPNLVFLLFTAGLLGLAWWIRGREQKAPAEPKPVKMAENNSVVEATWNDVQLEDSLGMEVGYRLIPMVDFQQDGELLGRIRSIRKKFAQEMGFLPPVVHIRDNMDLQPARYRILMKGVEMGSGDAYPGRWLAINPGTAAGTLPGEATVDPAFGLNAIWIESALKEQAQIQGYTVVEASTVVATHLNHLISQHAAELFGRQEAQQLLDRVAQEMPKLTEDLVPGVVTLTTLHKVLQNLLDEKVPIRDMRTILETLAEHAPIQSDPHELTAVVRVALGRAITQQWFPGKDEVHVIGLDTPLERLLLQALQGGGGLEPGLADRLLAQTQEALSRQEMLGAPPVLLVNHALRPLLSRFLRRSLPQLVVLSNLELSDNRHIRMTATIGGK
ncbi:flagellar biosynthesis protein FlhA [Escherichia coli]|nr:flagellar biosynthesis protein FlhA [Escherichia coli]